MDSIRITIVRGCNDDGTGGTVADDATAILGAMPNGTPIVDMLVAAFADAYGLHSVDGVTVNSYRNMAYRVRQYMTEIVSAFAAKTAVATAQSQAQAAVSEALGSVQILES